MKRPDTRKAVGLQLDAHLNAVRRRLAAGGVLHRRRLRQDAEQILHVVADLVRNHISLGEFARLAAAAVEAHLYVAEERRVEIDAPVARAIERPHRGLREAAAALLAAAIKTQARRTVLATRCLEDSAPCVFGIAQHGGNELPGRVGGRAGARRRLPVRLFVARMGNHLGAADQDARIDAGEPADQSQNGHRTDAQSAAADGNAEPAATAAISAAVAVILDIVAAAKIVPTHSTFLSTARLPSSSPKLL